MEFEVYTESAFAGRYERPGDALKKAQELQTEGAADVAIVDLVGRRFTPASFASAYILEKYSSPRPRPRRPTVSN